MSENSLNKWSKEQTREADALAKGVKKPYVFSWDKRKPEWEREPVQESEEDINKFIETLERRKAKEKEWADVDVKKFYKQPTKQPTGGKRKSRKGKSRKGKSKKSRKGKSKKSRKGKSKKSRNNRRK
jgi:hypothetical protein